VYLASRHQVSATFAWSTVQCMSVQDAYIIHMPVHLLCDQCRAGAMCSSSHPHAFYHKLLRYALLQYMTACCHATKACILTAMESPLMQRQLLPSRHMRELSMNANVEAHAYMCGHAAGGTHTRESMPAVCSSSTSVVLKTGYSHVLCMSPYTSGHGCWYG
jgi:hypothetical protein